MPQQAWNDKRERQYEHIKESTKEHGSSEGRAEEIAARTVNKDRAQTGESAQASRTATEDVSPEHRGGKRSGRGEGPPGGDEAAALRRREAGRRLRAVVDDQGPAEEGTRRPLSSVQADASG